MLGGPINGGVALASASGVNSLDDTGNRLFFVAFPDGVTPHLYSINTLSGAVLGSPALSGGSRHQHREHPGGGPGTSTPEGQGFRDGDRGWTT